MEVVSFKRVAEVEVLGGFCAENHRGAGEGEVSGTQ